MLSRCNSSSEMGEIMRGLWNYEKQEKCFKNTEWLVSWVMEMARKSWKSSVFSLAKSRLWMWIRLISAQSERSMDVSVMCVLWRRTAVTLEWMEGTMRTEINTPWLNCIFIQSPYTLNSELLRNPRSGLKIGPLLVKLIGERKNNFKPEKLLN